MNEKVKSGPTIYQHFGVGPKAKVANKWKETLVGA